MILIKEPLSDHAIDLDIVSSTWRSLHEPEGFDELISAWDRKFANSSSTARHLPVDATLSRLLGGLSSRLDSYADVETRDQLEVWVRRASSPAMALSPEGRVVTLNYGAADFFGIEQGQLAGTAWVQERSLGEFKKIRRAAVAGGNAAYAILRLIDQRGQECIAEAFPVQSAETDVTYTVIRSLELAWDGQINLHLAQAFGLTEAECAICKLLFSGCDVDAVAGARGVTTETVRTQIKRVLTKAELRSRVELIRLLGMLCARATAERERTSLEWSDPLRNEQIFTRADGRRLAYTWTGAANGTPILFLHGELPYFVQHENIQRKIADAGLKLIGMSTPGHGNSDPLPDADQLDDGTNAVFELCNALNLKGTPAFSSYTGNFYLANAAVREPGRFSSLMCIGLPWNFPAGRWRKLALNQKVFAQLAHSSPKIFELVCRLGFRMVEREGPDFYLLRSFGESEVDRKTIFDPEYQPLLRVCCRHLTSQGHKAFFNEMTMVGQNDLADLLGQLEVPMHWLIPGDAENLGPEEVNAARGISDTISVEIVPGTGELLPYQRPDIFIERLSKLANEGTPH
ncbi:hypothetical protein [Altererythrobacter sp. MF3-039]|uniref:hypothetical protein n=1 Tax=Altererythrobacter sp. MF3-039 TaxID=3252901 RepID=UPI00390CD31B